jgi:hypothetical protein
VNWDLITLFAIPGFVVVCIVAMIVAGWAKTDGVPPDPPNSYPERLDSLGRWVLGIATVLVFAAAAATLGPASAVLIFAALLAFNAIGALVWTCGQEVFGYRQGKDASGAVVPLSFGVRLSRNFREFYLRLISLFSH